MLDYKTKLSLNTSKSDYKTSEDSVIHTELHSTLYKAKSNILHIASGVTMLLGAQYTYSNPVLNISEQNIENAFDNYHRDIEYPSTYYLAEISTILKSNYTKKDVITEILSFKSLVNNWDGFGSIPLEIEASSNAIFFINEIGEKDLSSLTEITPNPNGTISFVWENNNNEILSLEIGNKTMSYYFSLLRAETIYINNIEIREKTIRDIAKLVSRI